LDNRCSIFVLGATLALLLFRLSADAGFSVATLTAFHQPDAGAAAALPSEVIDASRVVADLALDEVMFAGRFAPDIDMLLHQRLVEYLYPVRVVHGGPHFVLLAGDPLPAPTCSMVGQHGQVQVVRCD
jgi:hypothetical protein